MAKYHHTCIAELTHQLKLSPSRLRLGQLDATEYLIDLIATDKYYPYDFVCHHVTGYRPKSDSRFKPMLGKSLIEDLVILVEELSGTQPMPVAQFPAACWTTEELAGRLQVSTKTICRWRRRGLPGRKLRYPDGTVRMAFLERSVRRFVVQHYEQVKRGAAFTQLTPAEKRQIVELARQELAEHRMRLHELSQIIAAKVGRAVETVRYTLRRYDAKYPDEALFSKDNQPVVRPELRAVYDAVASGKKLSVVGKQFGKSTKAVQAIVREVRARRLIAQELSYIYNPEFELPGAPEKILAPLPNVPPDSSRSKRPPKDLPPYLQDLYQHPLLSTRQEQHLFRRYNFLKFKADRLRSELDPLSVTDETLNEIDALLQDAVQVKNDLLRANLRLVVSIARRHVGRSPHFFETVSDGNLALMRAVEKFDYARGFKFSTYASWAIMRNYARTIPEQAYQSARLMTGVDDLLASAPSQDETARQETFADGARHLLTKGLAVLSERERDIVVRHYGLDNGGQPETLDQIGRIFGVTKERVRQIERQAIRKLKECLTPDHASLVSD